MEKVAYRLQKLNVYYLVLSLRTEIIRQQWNWSPDRRKGLNLGTCMCVCVCVCVTSKKHMVELCIMYFNKWNNKNWKEKARNRAEWVNCIKGAKVRIGLQCLLWRKRRRRRRRRSVFVRDVFKDVSRKLFAKILFCGTKMFRSSALSATANCRQLSCLSVIRTQVCFPLQPYSDLFINVCHNLSQTL